MRWDCKPDIASGGRSFDQVLRLTPITTAAAGAAAVVVRGLPGVAPGAAVLDGCGGCGRLGCGRARCRGGGGTAGRGDPRWAGPRPGGRRSAAARPDCRGPVALITVPHPHIARVGDRDHEDSRIRKDQSRIMGHVSTRPQVAGALIDVIYQPCHPRPHARRPPPCGDHGPPTHPAHPPPAGPGPRWPGPDHPKITPPHPARSLRARHGAIAPAGQPWRHTAFCCHDQLAY